MGCLLDKPRTEKVSETGEGNGLRYGLSCMQGWRVEMEDAHTALAKLQGHLSRWSFFGVFDGHAGAKVAEHSSENLLSSIMNEQQFQTLLNQTEEIRENENVDMVKQAIRTGFLKLDEAMRQMPEVASGKDKSGTTAVCSLISPDYIYVANCGDSRAVLVRQSGICFNTLDHKPDNFREKRRIIDAGGAVMVSRVNGSLAVSRALGDFEYKNVEGKGPCEQLVSPEPELYVEKRDSNDQFLILACDGIWDVMSNEDIADFIRSRFLLTDNIETITNQVLDTCFHKGSKDNMSIVIVAFPNAPRVDPAAIKHEEQLDNKIIYTVKEWLASNDEVTDVQSVMEFLEDEKIEGLPPGGGLSSKFALIEEIFKVHRPAAEECEEA